jgi:hypothetical protein
MEAVVPPLPIREVAPHEFAVTDGREDERQMMIHDQHSMQIHNM